MAVFIIELREADEGMVDEGLELPDAAALPDMADNALGVFLAAFGSPPLCIFGTGSEKVQPKHTSCPLPQNLEPKQGFIDYQGIIPCRLNTLCFLASHFMSNDLQDSEILVLTMHQMSKMILSLHFHSFGF